MKSRVRSHCAWQAVPNVWTTDCEHASSQFSARTSSDGCTSQRRAQRSSLWLWRAEIKGLYIKCYIWIHLFTLLALLTDDIKNLKKLKWETNQKLVSRLGWKCDVQSVKWNIAVMCFRMFGCETLLYLNIFTDLQIRNTSLFLSDEENLRLYLNWFIQQLAVCTFWTEIMILNANGQTLLSQVLSVNCWLLIK